MHHAYLGGLLEHVISLCGLANKSRHTIRSWTSICYWTAAMLHDVGKLDETCYERAIGYTSKASSSATS